MVAISKVQEELEYVRNAILNEVNGALDEDIPEDLLQATEQFLNIYPTNGDELDYWKLFLTINFNELLM